MRKLLLLLFLSSICSLFSQEKYFFSPLSLENGLSQIGVTSIHQDRHNLMWFGTRNGLNKYDGYTFDAFLNNPQDSSSISDNHILCIAEDKYGYLWIGTNRGLNRYDARTNSFRNYFTSPDSTSLSSNTVRTIYFDNDSNLWIGTTSGLNRYNYDTDTFDQYFLDRLLNNNAINAIAEHDGKLYIGSIKKGLIIYDKLKQTTEVIENSESCLQRIPSNDVRAIYLKANGEMWLGTHHDGLCYRKNKTSPFVFYNQDNGLSNNYIRSITESPEGNIVVGTFNGLNVIARDGNITQYTSSSRTEGALSHYSVYCTYFDNNRTLWVGTYAGGLNYYNPFGQKFHFFDPGTSKGEMLGILGPMVETVSKLYVASEGGGLLEMDKNTNSFTQHKLFDDKQNFQAKNILKSLYLDGSKILCGTNLGTVYSFDIYTKKFELYYDFHQLNSIYQIGRFHNGDLFFAGVDEVGFGILSKDKKSYNKVFEQEEGTSFSFENVRKVFEIEDNVLLVGTRNNGFYYYNRNTKQLKEFRRLPTNTTSEILENYISDIYRDSMGNIWIGSFGGGLYAFDAQTLQIEVYNTARGLLSNNVCAIVEDEKNRLWISTTSGISEFDIEQKSFSNYSHDNGITINEFTPHAGHKLLDKRIAFSGNNGFILFNPRQVSANPFVPSLLLHKLYVNNTLVEPSPSNKILQGQLYTQNEITLNYNETNIGIEYSALNYLLSGKNEYKYYLEGLEDDWNNVGTRHMAYYTNLSPGDYTFRLKGSNNDGIWNQEEVSLRIMVLPPFWKTWWAYMLYLCTFAAVLYFILKNYNERKVLKQSIKIEQARAEAQAEFHETRNKLFTNFSHELRTPLTLIMSPLGDIIEKEKNLPSYVHQSHRLMYNNTLRMLRLVNNLMNFQKNESGTLQLRLENTDFQSFANETLSLFNDLAIKRDIAFSQDLELNHLTFFFDIDLMEKVFFNILSNAFKNVENGGTITFEAKKLSLGDVQQGFPHLALNKGGKYLFLQFADSGEGIPAEDLENIFAPFFQVAQNKHSSSGTGLGLSLSKSIVELHGGALWAENAEGGGAVFNCILPIITELGEVSASTTQHSPDSLLRKVEVYNEVAENGKRGNYAYTVLVVEDNTQVRSYITSLLADYYNITTAVDGKDGISKAKGNTSPDLIITDLMMPNMDGMQMTNILKNELETSHIPIIMLTAKAMTDNVLEGYKAGADAYITKPFESSILLAKVENILKERETLKAHYGKQYTLLKEFAEDASSIDEQFMQKLYKYLDQNISDVEFNLDDFSKELGMSRSSLYRKLKSITNLTPSEFIRNFRLEMGAKLLTDASLSVSDVYVAVGFNSIAYFSSSFKAYFGQTPTEYVQQRKDA